MQNLFYAWAFWFVRFNGYNVKRVATHTNIRSKLESKLQYCNENFMSRSFVAK